ncbi:MAG: zinc dependent phospholipase C family protein [Myxococcales bacterium]|nr:zinc dependent phospholipase C family protein [Myxococcota bacterium]MDW8280343.1 zinc dependent phospholipase C family protein [Myxococcales bacterium]
MRPLPLLFLLTLAGATCPRPGSAFSTRVHIHLANRVREALLERADGTLPLLRSPYAVRLRREDFEAIAAHPLAFRAGAVGPDNIAFPGMTDPTHAIEQRPYEQCELLYREAATPEERAYALGCFLHGTTDAVAHHLVNFLAGETFTLTPLNNARQHGYSNVVRHMIAESMFQRAAFRLDPEAFRTGPLLHSVPGSFLLRAYFAESSPLWQVMARRARARFEAQAARMPNATLPELLLAVDLAPAEHLVLTPLYLRGADALRRKAREDLVAAIATMQNPATPEGAQLRVSPGPDGRLGTSDDRTACTASCPLLYARYFTYVALLAPRLDASNNPLPSAFDKISDKLQQDLFQFLPAYVRTIENISARLNTPLSEDSDEFALDRAEVARLFAPLDAWAVNLTTLDYETAARAVVPDWLLAVQDALRAVGVNVSVAAILEAALRPIVQPIRDAIRTYVIERAKLFLEELRREYMRELDAVRAEYAQRLAAAAPMGLAGTVLDRLFDSGLYVHAYNFTAAALANHAVALPVGDDPVGAGPASFDASFTLAWSQPGLCGYLRRAVFPLGIDARGALSVRPSEGTDLMAPITDDSPVECHDGSLTAFARRPTVASCRLTDLAHLLADPAHRGSLTRSHPPELGEAPQVSCSYLEVPGLPGPDRAEMEGTGCGCRVGGRPPAAPGGWALLLGVALCIRCARRRRPVPPVVLLAVVALQPGCGPATDSMEEMRSDPPPSPPTRRQALLDALHRSVWHGRQMRGGVERAYELRFDARSFLWAEIQNPYGPARRRELRVFTVEEDGTTVRTTVSSPITWPDARDIGRRDEWKVEVVAGSPRRLRLQRGGMTEEFTEGPWPVPSAGLTATVRVFPSGGAVDKAFCSSGVNGFRYPVFFDFARGRSSEPVLGEDVVAGARLLKWRDASGQNRFAITDVDGFNTLGRTELSDQFNFFVTYRGRIHHPGGPFQMRELDDSVEDGVWVFLGDKVGSNSTADLFLEVHGFIWRDTTPDEPSIHVPAGEVPIEIIVARCAKQIEDVDVQLRLANGTYRLVGDTPSTPEVNETLFPPAL